MWFVLQNADIEHYGLDNSPIDQMDSEWLDNFFHDPVLNDRMMTDALQPQHVQSEHSYSLTNGEKVTLGGQIKLEPADKGIIFNSFSFCYEYTYIIQLTQYSLLCLCPISVLNSLFRYRT